MASVSILAAQMERAESATCRLSSMHDGTGANRCLQHIVLQHQVVGDVPLKRWWSYAAWNGWPVCMKRC